MCQVKINLEGTSMCIVKSRNLKKTSLSFVLINSINDLKVCWILVLKLLVGKYFLLFINCVNQ